MMTALSAAQWRRLGPALALGLLVFPGAATNAQDGRADPIPPTRRLTVTGQGIVRIKPDKTDITLGVVTENRSSQAAVKANAEASQRVQAAVMQRGVAQKDIQTVNYSVQPLLVGGPGGGSGGLPEPGGADSKPSKPAIVGYRVYNQVRVTVRDIGKMGDILDAATSAGSNTVESIGFGRDDQNAAEEEALTKAVADARRKADLIAKAAGVRIVGVYDINTGPAFRPGPVMYARAGAAAENAVTTPIAPGELTVTADVTIVYELSSGLGAAR